MSLKIVYGTAGTGKSTYMFQEIAQKIRENKANIYMITPEQFSFTAEKKLLEVAPNNAVITAEVITFERMAYRLLQEIGGETKTHLSSSR